MRKKQTPKRKAENELIKQWEIPKRSLLRYDSNVHKGIFWYWFARAVRKRDFEKYGTCISCGKPVDSIEELQAGHYAPASSCGFALLFDDMNVNGECGRCNGLDEGHLIGYENGLRMRYGNKATDALKERYYKRHQNLMQEWTRNEYLEKARKYKDYFFLNGGSYPQE
jgi:hypothetical protein